MSVFESLVDTVRELSTTHTMTEIGVRLGRSHNSIAYVCRRGGIRCLNRAPDPVAWAALVEQVRELAALGYSRGEIAGLVKKSRNSICGICWRNEIPTHGGNRIRRRRFKR